MNTQMKKEEGGQMIMCEVTEEFYRAGVEYGEQTGYRENRALISKWIGNRA